MSEDIPSKQSDAIMVILKIRGEAIHLWSPERMDTIGKSHTFTVSCKNNNNQEHSHSDIQVFALSNPAPVKDKCHFQPQQEGGEALSSNDMVTFMTGPVDNSDSETSYTIDIGIREQGRDHETSEKLGSAYLFLDPNFSSQGIQATQIRVAKTHVPIGQIQVEYLIITNPISFELPPPRPDWLTKAEQIEAGHRGSGSAQRMDLPEKLLENTIASFNYAHRNGADMCELDVLMSADGVPIVYHDFYVDAVAVHHPEEQTETIRKQVSELTVSQLRDITLLKMHDGEGCPYILNIPDQAENNKPFPTLEQVLEEVDQTCGLNIEIKWPQMLESGKMEARHFCEINRFVDKIIDTVKSHSGNRRIVLESFDADLVIMLRLKQDIYPVVFLCQGMTERFERYSDIRARSVRNGIYFAQAFNLAAIDLILDYYVISGEKLVRFINEHDLIARAWGEVWQGDQTLDYLKEINVQCITYDKVDLMKKCC